MYKTLNAAAAIKLSKREEIIMQPARKHPNHFFEFRLFFFFRFSSLLLFHLILFTQRYF